MRLPRELEWMVPKWRILELGTKMEGTKLVGAKTERSTDTVTSLPTGMRRRAILHYGRDHIGVSMDTEMMDTG